MFDPKTNKFPYTEYTDEHYLVVKKNDGTVFDEKYPYIDLSKKFLRKQKLTRILLRIIVFPFTKIRLGLKINGKQNLKKYKSVLDKGVVSVCNHVHMFDYLAIMSAIKNRHPYVLVWAPNIRGESGKMIRSVGGIPIPEDNINATMTYLSSIEKLLNSGGWLQIYAEGSMWEYYAPIRPFKKGPAFIASKFDKPILPLAFSYRKPNWIRRVIFKQIATFTLNIGEPLYVNKDLNKYEREMDLTIRAHEAVCALAGINNNLYPPVFGKNKRIDYYTSKYGVGYKKSW